MAVPGLVNAAAVASSDEGRCDVSLARPKSRILACPRWVMKILAGLMSRCTIPLEVRGVQGIRDLDRKIQQLIELDGRAFDAVLERLALQELHGDEGLMVLLPIS